MKRFPSLFIRVMQIVAVVVLFYGAFVGVALLVGEQPAHALPEYTGRTGESCGTCHVSAGGGGPRTLRGLLWSARGKPDAIPDLPGSLLAPGVNDGLELYDIACAGCHGFTGQGLFAINLVGNGASRATNRSFILRGIPNTEMPAFEAQLTDEQVDILVDFVTEMSRGAVELPEEYPLPRPELKCEPIEAGSACGGK